MQGLEEGFKDEKTSWCLCDRYSSPGSSRERKYRGRNCIRVPFPMRTWWKTTAFALLLLPWAHSERTVHCPHMNVTCLHECSQPEQAAGGNVTVEEAHGLCLGLISRGVFWHICDYCIIKYCRVFVGQIVVAKTFIKLSLITGCCKVAGPPAFMFLNLILVSSVL